MRFRYSRPALPALLFLVLLAGAAAAAPAVPPTPPDYVVDLAGLLDAGTRRALSASLRELEQKTSAQFVILTVPSLDGEPLEEFSLHVAHDLWRLGQAGKDNGLLLLVAVKERRYRIEVGYGLEEAIPDSLAGSIGRTYLVPWFRRGDYARGIREAAAALAGAVARSYGVSLTGMPAPAPACP